MTRVTLTVQAEFTLEVPEGVDEAQALDSMFANVQEYLTSPEHPFLEDYGPEAWGGYEGPVVVVSTVERKR